MIASVRWQDRALCAQIGSDFWFPERGESTREAKAMCRRCPVRTACLEYALAAEDGLDWRSRDGVWGGLSPRERERLAWERAFAARAAA